MNCFHIDTNVLLKLESLRGLMQKCRNSGCVIKVSPFTLTEFINEYSKRYMRLSKRASYTSNDPLYVLLDGMAEGLIDVFVIRDEKLDDFISYINVLRDEVTWLHSMDILILALALVDEECHGLVTLDSKITESRKIKEIFRKAKKNLYNEELKRY